MKFRKFGKALLMSALSVGVVLGVTSCVQSYTVGFLYVTGTMTSGSDGQGIISGYKIDHNTGNLVAIHGLPVPSGGAYPVRAVLTGGSRFIYVLNRGVDPATNGGPCTASTANCSGANIVQFAVGGNGILTPQQTFFSQGKNPFRIVTDSSKFIYVLDAVAPDDAPCSTVLSGSPTTCADVTAFSIDQSTGRLTLVINAQVTSSTGAALPYFPVPANPIDFALTGSYLLTLAGTAGTTAQTGDVVFPYAYSSSTGQLTVSQSGSQAINAANGTAIIYSTTGVYVLDAEAVDITPTDSTTSVHYQAQILTFSVGTGGALQALNGGVVGDDTTQTNPIMLLVESKGKWLYVANQGDNSSDQAATSGIVGYFYTSSNPLAFQSYSPYTVGSGPQCLIEDPSNQYIYTANYNDSTVTGKSLDVNSGNLNPLSGKAHQSVTLDGPPTWCLVSGRTS